MINQQLKETHCSLVQLLHGALQNNEGILHVGYPSNKTSKQGAALRCNKMIFVGIREVVRSPVQLLLMLHCVHHSCRRNEILIAR